MTSTLSEAQEQAPPPSSHAPVGEVAKEAARRRTFAVISHPDAGKSTLTEALALHAQVITEAGAVHGDPEGGPARDGPVRQHHPAPAERVDHLGPAPG